MLFRWFLFHNNLFSGKNILTKETCQRKVLLTIGIIHVVVLLIYCIVSTKLAIIIWLSAYVRHFYAFKRVQYVNQFVDNLNCYTNTGRIATRIDVLIYICLFSLLSMEICFIIF